MVGLFSDIGSAFLLGLLTPLTAVCVLPLYPAFLSYLANQYTPDASRKQYAMFGLLITLGVIAFMTLLGLVFTTLLQVSLTQVIGILSPVAFGILGVISLLLIFDVDLSRFIPKAKSPKLTQHPTVNALVYGFFFGAIVIPCNPAFIAVFFTQAVLVASPVASMLTFISFGIGLGFPLLVFSLLSAQWSQAIIGFLTHHKRMINLIAGVIMLGISAYYLVFVFRVFG